MTGHGPHCARTIRAAYDGEFAGVGTTALRLRVSTAGPYALVSWSTADAAGMSLFHHRGSRWCRTSTGGGSFRETDVVGFDGVDRATAHRLFRTPPVTSTADAR